MVKSERQVLLETRLRNLKRTYSKMIDHSDLLDECIELKAEIDGIERELKLMN